ncbi:N-acetylmuramoyl-L-alanine amidase [Bifidobacterium myosotis]|uniref:N-acetylmuramoyl-L-alanine amidase n=1 Tax=Bifidobacterium myosotis TaxID=1630166 RepID=A0A5M9ZI80_9BIFI|nr:N-acetylmuramoyl-L-alanine amidase [Bifidobacterium myosotis]KAA8827260.1 N-acetylmuramoyl-L-alanine amidase [Bifidobacterium myosotis]
MTGSSLAIWRGSPNHYNGRNGYAIDHITFHIMVGTLAGTDYCFQLASFMAASHYGVGSDGTIHQWVDENDGSWADANMASDCSGITIEHAGGLAGIPVTAEEIEASARLCADIARRYGWTRLWHDGLNGNVYLHREIPGTDHFGCPDNTINGLPVQTILDRANELLEGDDMPTVEEIWNADINGVKARDRLIGIDNAANGINNRVNGEEWKWLTSRVYRTMLMLKRACGIPDNVIDVPEPVNVKLSDEQMDQLARKVAELVKGN